MDLLIESIKTHGIEFLVCGAFGLIALWLKCLLKTVMKGIEDLKDAFLNLKAMSMASTQDRIVYLVTSFQKRGYVTIRDKAILKEMYIPYRAEGGNSYAKEAMAELEKISVKETKE